MVNLNNNAEIAEILDVTVEECVSSLKVNQLDAWDSLARLSILSYLDDKFNLVLDGEQLAAVVTLGDIEMLISSEIGK